jgi:acyl-CoA synthetase (AMP-forming)/AMP-acid ligase II
MLTTFVVGGALIIMPKWDAGEALKLIEREKVSAFTGVPTMALEIMNHPDRDLHDLSSLGDIQSGGAPRPSSHVARQAEEMPKIRSVQGYGLTETNAVGAGIFWDNYRDRPQSTGKAQPPFVEIRILGEDGAPLPHGAVGEIAIRAAATIRAYWNDPAATAAAYTADHFFKTGDVGYLDDEEYLFIVDRKKEIIIRGGENISTAEVEAAIYAFPGVAEASVFGAPDERLGEIPVAVVHPGPDAAFTPTELAAFLAGRLARFKVPDRFIIVAEDLPKLGTGKIDRRALKARYAH